MAMEIIIDDYIFTDSTYKIELDEVHNLLKQSYWWKNQQKSFGQKTPINYIQNVALNKKIIMNLCLIEISPVYTDLKH